MSYITSKRSVRRSSAAVGAFALIAGLALQAAPAVAGQVSPRDFQAFGYDIRTQQEGSEWRKPNGAEILGGFAGADDEINSRTGEVRRR